MSITLNAQFITELNPSETEFSTSEETRWQYISNMASTQSIHLVEIEALSSNVLAGEAFTFSLPGVATELEAQGRFIQQTSAEDYVWWANLSNDRGYFGIASNATQMFFTMDWPRGRPLTSMLDTPHIPFAV